MFFCVDEEFTETKETGSYEGSTRRVAEVQAYHPLEAQSGCRAARLEEGAIVFEMRWAEDAWRGFTRMPYLRYLTYAFTKTSILAPSGAHLVIHIF
jgi:hypothetical protein